MSEHDTDNLAGNGKGKLDWLDQARVYAALVETDDLDRAAALLERIGLFLPGRRLANLRTGATRQLERLREAGLAPALLGPEGRLQARILLLDRVCRFYGERLLSEPLVFDRELAAFLQQFRELFALVSLLDRPMEEECDGATGSVDRAQASAVVDHLIEALDYAQAPERDSLGAACDAARRLAAATGQALPAPGPD